MLGLTSERKYKSDIWDKNNEISILKTTYDIAKNKIGKLVRENKTLKRLLVELIDIRSQIECPKLTEIYRELKKDGQEVSRNLVKISYDKNGKTIFAEVDAKIEINDNTFIYRTKNGWILAKVATASSPCFPYMETVQLFLKTETDCLVDDTVETKVGKKEKLTESLLDLIDSAD